MNLQSHCPAELQTRENLYHLLILTNSTWLFNHELTFNPPTIIVKWHHSHCNVNVSYISQPTVVLWDVSKVLASPTFHITMDIVSLIAGIALIHNGWHAIYDLLPLNHHWHNCIIGMPLFFDNIVMHSSKSLHMFLHLLSLSQQVPLEVAFVLSIPSSSIEIYKVTLLISQNNQCICHIHCEYYDGQHVAWPLWPFRIVSWPLIDKIIVMGFGIKRGIHHMTFAHWDLQLFFNGVESAPDIHMLKHTFLKAKMAEEKHSSVNHMDTLYIVTARAVQVQLY